MVNKKEPEFFDPTKHTLQNLVDAFNELEKYRHKHRLMVEKCHDKKRATELNITYDEYIELKNKQANEAKNNTDDTPPTIVIKKTRGRPRKVVLPREVIDKRDYMRLQSSIADVEDVEDVEDDL